MYITIQHSTTIDIDDTDTDALRRLDLLLIEGGVQGGHLAARIEELYSYDPATALRNILTQFQDYVAEEEMSVMEVDVDGLTFPFAERDEDEQDDEDDEPATLVLPAMVTHGGMTDLT